MCVCAHARTHTYSCTPRTHAAHAVSHTHTHTHSHTHKHAHKLVYETHHSKHQLQFKNSVSLWFVPFSEPASRPQRHSERPHSERSVDPATEGSVRAWAPPTAVFPPLPHVSKPRHSRGKWVCSHPAVVPCPPGWLGILSRPHFSYNFWMGENWGACRNPEKFGERAFYSLGPQELGIFRISSWHH